MTPSLEVWPAKAKEALSPYEVRLAPLGTNPVFQCLGDTILQTHPIQEELHGNGNGLLVISKSIDEIFPWIFKRASRASVTVLLSIPISCNTLQVSLFVTLTHILVTSFLPQISERISVLDLWAKVI